MHKHTLWHLSMLLVLLFTWVRPPVPAQTAATEPWWDDAWPYRVPVTVSGSGVVQVSLNFTALFAALGLNGALLDVRSLRVVPVIDNTLGAPLPHAETYSRLLHDAETPAGWSTNDLGAVARDTARFTQGSASVRTIVTNTVGGYGYPGVELHPTALTDWRPYEVFVYDIWPEVNASALDQTPDLYWFKLYNTTGCPTTAITQGGPALALDRWNAVSISLKPFATCTTPNFSAITRLEFHTRDDVDGDVSGPNGLWDDGDVWRAWWDNLRLVDQDGGGVIKWQASGDTTRYTIYFDTLAHEGHPQPVLATLGTATLTGSAGSPEAGGYYHGIAGASTGALALWSAPPTEKILRTQTAPAVSAPLRVQAARGESEPFQLVVRAPAAQSLAVTVSDFSRDGAHIPAAAVTLHRVDYVTLTRLSDAWGRLGETPDPLMPIAPGATVAFPAGRNQPLWFTIHVPRDAAPGLYHGTVTIGAATVPVELEVWSFALPQELHLASEWGFGWSQVVERYKGTVGGSVQPCYWTLVDALYEDFAAHRLTPKGVGWPAGLNYPGGVEYDCNGGLDPDAWGAWDFHTLAQQYLAGAALENGVGFPTFLIRGPVSNWPPDSRPASFCGTSRGTEPPGSAAYNAKWFQYWAAVSAYLEATGDYAARGYYHIVNEPQTLADYNIVAYLAQQTKSAAPWVRLMVSEQVEAGIYANPSYPGAKIDIWLPTISNYEVSAAHDRQVAHGEEVWWYFLYGDRPPLPNPTVIDRPGIEARITPWLAWLERVDGLLYYATTDWSPDPWAQPWINDGNGDGFLFYPPPDGTVAFDACNSQSNRLVTSLRWELLREGMEDYELLWLVNGGARPEIGVANPADALAQDFVASRTLFSRVPTDLVAARAALAAQLTGPTASKRAVPGVFPAGRPFAYQLVYEAGAIAHTVFISDTAPATAVVLGASSSQGPAPEVTGQRVTWEAPVAAHERVTVTISAQSTTAGLLVNTAVFSGTQRLTATAEALAAVAQVYLPVVLREE